MSRELEEALRELALEIAQCYATIEQQRTAMRQALEALESKYIVNCGAWRHQQDQAITALRERLGENT